VVVTGLGVVSPLGCGVDTAWARLCQGASSAVTLQGDNFSKVPSKVACLVPRGEGKGDLDLEREFSRGDQQRLSLSMMFGLLAAREALEDAGWEPRTEQQRVRSGVSVGMGMVDLEYIGQNYLALMQGGRKVSPYFVPRILPNLAAGHISIAHGLMGPNHSCSTACATGAHSIGDAVNLIRRNVCDVMLAGGVDACVNPLAMVGFSRARALSTKYNSSPSRASRPFDSERDGFVMGEGAGVLVLESEQHARERGANIHCRITGFGSSGDAHHITTAREDGAGAVSAMTQALAEAGLSGHQVWAVNAHATSTPLGDRAEAAAIARVVEGGDSPCYVTSNKGALGHLLGAAGAVEAVFSVLSVKSGLLPPSINIQSLDTEIAGLGLNIVRDGSLLCDRQKRVLLKNSFGFGGTNASLVFENYL